MQLPISSVSYSVTSAFPLLHSGTLPLVFASLALWSLTTPFTFSCLSRQENAVNPSLSAPFLLLESPQASYALCPLSAMIPSSSRVFSYLLLSLTLHSRHLPTAREAPLFHFFC